MLKKYSFNDWYLIVKTMITELRWCIIEFQCWRYQVCPWAGHGVVPLRANQGQWSPPLWAVEGVMKSWTWMRYSVSDTDQRTDRLTQSVNGGCRFLSPPCLQSHWALSRFSAHYCPSQQLSKNMLIRRVTSISLLNSKRWCLWENVWKGKASLCPLDPCSSSNPSGLPENHVLVSSEVCSLFLPQWEI